MRSFAAAKVVVGGVVVAVLGLGAWDWAQLARRSDLAAPPQERATRIVVDKGARRLDLMRGDAVLKSYAVSLGTDPVGHKQREGDGRTPEGRYAIDFKNARSRFHLSMRVSYPSPEDRDSAARRGVPTGGDIMIHGLPNGLGWLGSLHRARDWTDGCIAVTNAEMDEIWAHVDAGTSIEIKP